MLTPMKKIYLVIYVVIMSFEILLPLGLFVVVVVLPHIG